MFSDSNFITFVIIISILVGGASKIILNSDSSMLGLPPVVVALYFV